MTGSQGRKEGGRKKVMWGFFHDGKLIEIAYRMRLGLGLGLDF